MAMTTDCRPAALCQMELPVRKRAQARRRLAMRRRRSAPAFLDCYLANHCTAAIPRGACIEILPGVHELQCPRAGPTDSPDRATGVLAAVYACLTATMRALRRRDGIGRHVDADAHRTQCASDAMTSDAMTPTSSPMRATQQAPPPALPPGDVTQFDRNRQGFVYPIRLLATGARRHADPHPAGGRHRILRRAELDVGSGASDSPTGCFPNQLYAAASQGDRLYVTSMCASPAGPLGVAKNADGSNNPANFKTVVHPVVFAIDTTNNVEVPEERVVLTPELRASLLRRRPRDRAPVSAHSQRHRRSANAPGRQSQLF